MRTYLLYDEAKKFVDMVFEKFSHIMKSFDDKTFGECKICEKEAYKRYLKNPESRKFYGEWAALFCKDVCCKASKKSSNDKVSFEEVKKIYQSTDFEEIFFHLDALGYQKYLETKEELSK
ncbi:MAG: hypothetical protein ACI4TI_01630 [Christensenellales bacterium]